MCPASRPCSPTGSRSSALPLRSHRTALACLLERPVNAPAERATVYELVLRPVERPRIELAGRTSAARIRDAEIDTIGAALLAAAPGDIVEIAGGRHAAPAETFPLRVPEGVVLRGEGAVLDAGGAAVEAVVVLTGHRSGVHGLTISGVSAPGFLRPATGVLARDVSEPMCTIPNPLREALLTEPLVVSDSRVAPPTNPGLGVRLSPEVEAEFPLQPGQGHVIT